MESWKDRAQWGNVSRQFSSRLTQQLRKIRSYDHWQLPVETRQSPADELRLVPYVFLTEGKKFHFSNNGEIVIIFYRKPQTYFTAIHRLESQDESVLWRHRRSQWLSITNVQIFDCVLLMSNRYNFAIVVFQINKKWNEITLDKFVQLLQIKAAMDVNS